MPATALSAAWLPPQLMQQRQQQLAAAPTSEDTAAEAVVPPGRDAPASSSYAVLGGAAGGRRLVVAASKPAGALFAWCSGALAPGVPAAAAGHAGQAPNGDDAGAGGGGGSCGHSVTQVLAAVCCPAASSSCMQQGAHGTRHASGVALVPGLPLVVSAGMDGCLRCWELSLAAAPAPAPQAAAAGPEPARPAPQLVLLDVTGDGVPRLDPWAAAPGAAGGAAAPPRRPIQGIACSGNGLVVAVVHSLRSKVTTTAPTIMVHRRWVACWLPGGAAVQCARNGASPAKPGGHAASRQASRSRTLCEQNGM